MEKNKQIINPKKYYTALGTSSEHPTKVVHVSMYKRN